MEIALVDGQRQKPQPLLKGICQACGKPALAKCGEKILWHWAHQSRNSCDPWWENETDWHRRWKYMFPEDWHEVVRHDSATGERHIADVLTSNGLVIELQHSAMPPDELRSREAFYKRMIWIVDATPFASQFTVEYKLPDPLSELCKDVRFSGRGVFFSRQSEKVPGLSSGWLYPRERIEAEIEASYRGHHSFKWSKPRTVWFESTMPVFLDFGTDELFSLQIYDDTGMRCVRRISKEALIFKNGGTYRY